MVLYKSIYLLIYLNIIKYLVH